MTAEEIKHAAQEDGKQKNCSARFITTKSPWAVTHKSHEHNKMRVLVTASIYWLNINADIKMPSENAQHV